MAKEDGRPLEVDTYYIRLRSVRLFVRYSQSHRREVTPSLDRRPFSWSGATPEGTLHSVLKALLHARPIDHQRVGFES